MAQKIAYEVEPPKYIEVELTDDMKVAKAEMVDPSLSDDFDWAEWYEGLAFANDDERHEYLAFSEKTNQSYEDWRVTRTDPANRKQFDEWKVEWQAEQAADDERRESRQMTKAEAEPKAAEKTIAAAVEERGPELAAIATEEAEDVPKISECFHVIGTSKGGTYGKSKK